MGADTVILQFPIGSWHGWGIRGLGTTLYWPGTAISAMPSDAELPPDDSRWPLLRERLRQSANFQNEILAKSGQIVELDAPVLVALGNDLTPTPAAYGRHLRGKPHIGCLVFEDVETVERNIERLKPYDAVVVASWWNKEVLDTLGVGAILCHEGIDPVIFNPSVQHKPRNDGKFRVFSGGKVEHRKAQDLVIEAFKLFADKYDDAVLVAAWSSPFNSGADFEGRWAHGAPPGLHLGKPNLRAWVQRAGIKPHQFELVPPMPNWKMAGVYGSCDAGLFLNRREGGTNFVAMEAMACGVPCALFCGERVGHLDLGVWTTEPAFRCICYYYRDEGALVTEAVRWLGAGKEHLTTEVVPPYWTWARHCREMSEIVENT